MVYTTTTTIDSNTIGSGYMSVDVLIAQTILKYGTIALTDLPRNEWV